LLIAASGLYTTISPSRSQLQIIRTDVLLEHSYPNRRIFIYVIRSEIIW
jgi:hypothetical protein